ncbi:hypothetical protein [Exiguobacterium flavidum]|uniref:hypothetical protein n=1 Tax=Exiguobacterium flavidum TaxID=2184695 RepID=UPI000DF7E557|nr:hypothetical protein [Exiguobacterium flavidum]
MEYTALNERGDYRSGDWISLKTNEAGESRDGMITEFESDGFWMRFEDDWEFEDFIAYTDRYLCALIKRPIDVLANYPALEGYPKLTAELQDRINQGFEIDSSETQEDSILFHIRITEAGTPYTQTLRGYYEDEIDRFEYVT